MSKITKVVLAVVVAASTLNVMGAPRRNRTTNTQKPAQTRTSGIPKISDPLDNVLKYYRNVDNSIPGVVQWSTFSFKVVRVISDREGIFAVYNRYEMYSASTREHVRDNRRIAEIYIKGLDLSEKADGDVIPLENGKTVWRIGVYRMGRRSYPKYTADRSEAAEYARTHKKK